MDQGLVVDELITLARLDAPVEHQGLAVGGRLEDFDGRIQSSQADEFIYHEALVHPGMLTTDAAPRSALVIGGGEGATLREILRYPSVTRAVMVDIDGEVVELCKKHLEEMHRGAFDDKRTELRTEDARAYLDKTTEHFDFVSVDLVEPLEEGPACMLFTKEFYALIGERLTPGGTMTVQAGMTKINALSFFTAIHRTLRDVFPVVAGYQTFVSCFGTPWGFIVATKKIDPRRQDSQTIDKLIAERVGGTLTYWDGLTHQHAFALPKFLRQALDAETRVSSDANPLIFA